MTDEPNQENRNEQYDKTHRRLLESLERNIDRAAHTAARLDRTLITLSAGALVLSMNFVNALAPDRHIVWMLFFAWACLLTTMLVVILAMRAEQTATNREIKKTGKDLEKLEQNPAVAKEAMAEMGEQLPISATQVTQHKWVGRLNLWALAAFFAGVLALAIFAAYNLYCN